METKNNGLLEKKNALIAALGLILLGILGSLFIWENGGRDEDADFTGSMGQQSSQNSTSEDKSAENQISKSTDAAGGNSSRTVADSAPENYAKSENVDPAGETKQESSGNNIVENSSGQNQAAENTGTAGGGATQAIANPASENCVKKGGTLAIKERPVGQYGVCIFDDNRQCEEWAMFRGECPVGGLKIAGYATEAAAYCAITGGEYAIKEDKSAAVEQGNCKFKSGKTCDVWEFWNGKCGKE